MRSAPEVLVQVSASVILLFIEIQQQISQPAADVLLDLTSMSDFSLGEVFIRSK